MSGQENRTRGQRMAGTALEKVEQAAKDTLTRKDYKTRAMGFPALVMQAGLAQAIGFLRSKSGTPPNAYARYLADLAVVMGKVDAKALHDAVIHAPIPDYRYLTRDALDAAGWLKRFSQTLLIEQDGRE